MESIHPNDIITMDLNSISYLTLKNGNMVLIDDSVPEKGNKKNIKFPKSSNLDKKDSKIVQKKIKLEITSPSSLHFKGIKIKNNNKENDRRKYDYKIFNKIIKNENFFIKGIRTNQNNFNNNNIFEKEKENIPLNNINNHFNMDNTSKFSYNKDDKNDLYRRSQIPKENEVPRVHFNFNDNMNNNINNNDTNLQSEYNQNKLNSNLNTNMSIPITGSNNNNENQFDLNSNNSNLNHESKRKNKSKIFGFFGKDKKVRISINAVCSLNIKAEDKYKINLINQFNNLVDRLNGEREKDTVNKLIESERADKFSKFYPLYKNKTHDDIIKKNIEMMNQNYNFNKDFNSEIINNTIKNKTLNNFYKKDNITGFSGFNINNSNKNSMFNQNIRKASGNSSKEIEKLKNKIQRLSSGIVRPSNRIFNI